VLALIPATLMAYGRFVEPQLLTVTRADIALPGAEAGGYTVRIALFSDTHHGVYKNAMPMQRIVDKVNGEEVDAVFIAGDFLYELAPEKVAETVAPLAQSKAPVYAVTGNHDVGYPGPALGPELTAALEAADVIVVDNISLVTQIGGHAIEVAGVSDLWEGQQLFMRSVDEPRPPLIVLTHNPDTALAAPESYGFDLMLAGHTHGGQIRLPFLVQAVIPTEYPFDKGIHRVAVGTRAERLVYVTPGTGMVGLPMRFAMPPRIDVLTLRLPPDR